MALTVKTSWRCSRCGDENPLDVSTCRGCGAEIDRANAAVVEEMATVDTAYQRTVWTVAAVLGAVALVVGLSKSCGG